MHAFINVLYMSYIKQLSCVWNTMALYHSEAVATNMVAVILGGLRVLSCAMMTTNISVS